MLSFSVLSLFRGLAPRAARWWEGCAEYYRHFSPNGRNDPQKLFSPQISNELPKLLHFIPTRNYKLFYWRL